MSCSRCGSWAINHGHHGRDGSEPNLCDVCYWRKRTEAKDAELAGYVEANRYMKGELDDALEDARKYAEAQQKVQRLISENASLRHQIREPSGLHAFLSEPDRQKDAEIARRVEDAYREAVDSLNPCFATADALWEGSDARKQLEAK